MTLYLLHAIIVIVMWELKRLTSRGGNSTRRIFTYALAAIIAVFLWTILLVPQTHAAATASWTGASIVYSGHQYFSAGKAAAGDSVNLPIGSSYYTHIETTNPQPLTQKAYVIYFAPGQDPGTATTATYVTYDFANKTFSQPQGQTTISISPQNSSNSNQYSSCSVTGGLGWIICPVSVTIAGGMDWVLGVISSFMQVQPTTVGDSNNIMFIAWNLMRSIANVAFIIVFMVIIYSQLTNVGISNYGIKKLLPRLVIAAVLVNISYYICALAIDLSNVVGYSMQGFFESIRTNVFAITNDTWKAGMWSLQSITEFVLSGGSAAIAGGAGLLIATGGDITAAIFLLLPVLVGLFLAVLVAFLILAARQAIIVILLIISPLAFVANLLPNTEQWFKKWRELFTTMLIFFPAFAVVFGGAQLAGGIIIQSAASINIVILGIIVQLAPLAISPLLLKLSGSLLGKIASLANTPNKLIKDRTKQWSNERAEMYRKRALSTQARFNLARRTAQWGDNRARRIKERSELYDKMGDNRYHNAHGGGKYSSHKLHELKHAAETEAKRIEEQMNRDLNIKIRTDSKLLAKELEVRTLTDEAAAAKGMIDKIHEDLRTGNGPGGALVAIANRSREATRNLALTAIAINQAKGLQNDQLSEALQTNIATIAGQRVRAYAGGVNGDIGEASALTFAVNQQREAQNKLITERTQLIKHFKLDGGKRQNLAEGVDVNVEDAAGNVVYTFKGNDEFAREASIEMQLKTGSYEEIESLISLSGIDDTTTVQRRINGRPVFRDRDGKTVFHNTGDPIMVKGAKSYAQTIGDAVFANNLAGKGMFFGGRFINNIQRGDVGGEAGLNFGITMSILDGKIKAEDIANNDAGAIRRYIEVAQNAQRGNFEPYAVGRERQMLANIAALKQTAAQILDPASEVGKNAAQSTKDELARLLRTL